MKAYEIGSQYAIVCGPYMCEVADISHLDAEVLPSEQNMTYSEFCEMLRHEKMHWPVLAELTRGGDEERDDWRYSKWEIVGSSDDRYIFTTDGWQHHVPDMSDTWVEGVTIRRANDIGNQYAICDPGNDYPYNEVDMSRCLDRIRLVRQNMTYDEFCAMLLADAPYEDPEEYRDLILQVLKDNSDYIDKQEWLFAKWDIIDSHDGACYYTTDGWQ